MFIDVRLCSLYKFHISASQWRGREGHMIRFRGFTCLYIVYKYNNNLRLHLVESSKYSVLSSIFCELNYLVYITVVLC